MSERKNSATAEPKTEDFVISRSFAAPRRLVWAAFTEAKHLQHWWSPKDFTVTAVKMDLRPGGIFHYGLRAPTGQELWGKWVFREIVAPERIVCITSFADESCKTVRHPFAPDWPLDILSTMTFAERAGTTTVTIRWSPLNVTEAERKGFDIGRGQLKDGFTGTLDQLETYLAKQ